MNIWEREGLAADNAPDIDAAIRWAGLNYTVSKEQLYAVLDPLEGIDWRAKIRRLMGGFGGKALVAEGCFAIWRHDTDSALGQVGEDYETRQNVDVFSWADNEALTPYYGGQFNGGRDAWMIYGAGSKTGLVAQMKSDGDDAPIVVDEVFNDFIMQVVPAVVVTNNHSGRFKPAYTPVCVTRLSKATVLVGESSHLSPEGIPVGELVAQYRRWAAAFDVLRNRKLTAEEHERLILEPAVPIEHLHESLAERQADGRSTAYTETAIEKASAKRSILIDRWFTDQGHEGEGSAWEALCGYAAAVDHDEEFAPRDGLRVRALLQGAAGRDRRKMLDSLMEDARLADRLSDFR